jgi:hypothetical protein
MYEFLGTVFLLSKNNSAQSFLPVHKITKASTLDADNFEIIEIRNENFCQTNTENDIKQILYHNKKDVIVYPFFIKTDITSLALCNINKEFPSYKIIRKEDGLLFLPKTVSKL